MPPNIIAPAEAFRLLLHARLSARHDRAFKFVDKIASYYWFWRWKTLGVPRSVHAIADETLKVLCKYIRDGNIRLQSRSQNPPIDIDPIDCSLGELDIFDQTLTIRAQSAGPARVYQHVYCVESDVMKVVRAISTLLPASDEDICDEIAAVYEEALPNINQLPASVQQRLKARGLEASGSRIKTLGSDQKFRLHRRAAGERTT